MKISYNWLKEYLNINASAEDVSAILTDNGLEVEGLEKHEQIKGGLNGIVVGKVLECSHIEGTEHLSLTKVDVGSEQLQIVCGAPNVSAGQKVVVALPGTVLYSSDGSSFKIKKAKIRGIESNGMICAEDEIGVGTSHAGIMVLDDDAQVGMPASKYFNISSDWIFEIGLTPNRSDAMCHTGVARDLAAAFHARLSDNSVVFKLPSVSDFAVDNAEFDATVDVQNPDACIRYTGLILSDLKVGESPNWLKNILESVGLRPINVVVDVTQFIMLELAQPLHAFDYDKIKGGKVVVKNVAEGTPFTTLDGVSRKLTSQDLMICDMEKPMCIPGVFGGDYSGVSFETNKVFLESACFNPTSVRKTARHHGLNTDASFRYERGTDPEITVYAIKRAALLLKEITGCKISSNISDFYPKKVERPLVSINFSKMNDFIGEKIPQQVAINILKDLDFEIIKQENENIEVAVPTNRVDVLRDVDVYEEILRIFGYNNVAMPEKSNTVYPEKTGLVLHELKKKLSDFLSAKGFNEIMCNSLNGMQWYEKSKAFALDKIVEVNNPLSRELNVLRATMLHGMLQSIAYNVNRNVSDLRFYESGKIYFKESSDKTKAVTKRFSETNVLSFALTGNNYPENWKYKSENTDLFDIKSVLTSVFKYFGVNEVISEKNDIPTYFTYGLSFNINEKSIAHIGLVDSKIASLSDVDLPVWFAEINLDLLLEELRKKEFKYKSISKYPTVRRDLSLLVDSNVSFEAIQKAAIDVDRKILKKVNLFDVYIDKKLGNEKKSYAVSFMFGRDDRTLTDNEVDSTMQKISQNIINVTKALIR